MLTKTIKYFSIPVQEYSIKNINNKIFDLLKPHCEKSYTYREVSGKLRYRCTHNEPKFLNNNIEFYAKIRLDKLYNGD
jgi:hypothetical protein